MTLNWHISGFLVTRIWLECAFGLCTKCHYTSKWTIIHVVTDNEATKMENAIQQ